MACVDKSSGDIEENTIGHELIKVAYAATLTLRGSMSLKFFEKPVLMLKPRKVRKELIGKVR